MSTQTTSPMRPLLLNAARTDDTAAVLDLFAMVVAADPDYAPVVTSGEVSLPDWFHRKATDAALLVYEDDRLVGHVAIRHWHNLPGGARTPLSRPFEMCRLAVHPDVQRHGIAIVLVRSVHRRYGDTLWATCHAGHRSHALLAGLGWADHSAVTWDDDPRAGMCLFAPTHLTSPAPRVQGKR